MPSEQRAPYDILGVGAPFIDHILPVSEEYLATIPGEKGGMQPVDYQTLRAIIDDSGAEALLRVGGSGANTIKGLANLGHRCALLGKVGMDPAGKAFLKSLKSLNIQSLLIPTSTPTGQLVCLVTPDGQRTFRDFLGSQLEMRPEDLNPHHFEGVQWVHIEGYTLLNERLTIRAMEYAKRAGAKISFDLASFELAARYKIHIIHLLAHHVDIVFANREETRALTGMDHEKGCAVLKDICGIAVVLMGADGCFIGHEQEILHCPAYPVNPLDTTGAGDIFAAGFLHGYLTGKSLRECARYGALAAAEVVQVYGAEIPQDSWARIKNDFNNNNNT